MIDCIHCGKPIEEIHDTTYSKGELTGEIYLCEKCDLCTIDDFLNGTERAWTYE